MTCVSLGKKPATATSFIDVHILCFRIMFKLPFATLTRSCRQRGIKKQHVFFGGEDVNSYAENFVNTLRSKGWLVAGVNAHDAKKQRSNLQANTDRLDLMGIATMLLNCRANCYPAQPGNL